MSKTYKITIKADGDFTKRVPVGVNGQITHLPVGEEIEVGEHILSALDGSRFTFTVASSSDGADDAESGVGSASSTTEHTALQQEPVNEPLYGAGGTNADPVAEPNALGTGAAGSATGEVGDGTGFRDDQANKAEVNDLAPQSATTGQDGAQGSSTETEGGEATTPSSPTEGGKPGAADNAGGDTAHTADTSSETVSSLTQRAGTVDDSAQIDRMIGEERSREGGGRSTAIKALEARKAELSA